MWHLLSVHVLIYICTCICKLKTADTTHAGLAHTHACMHACETVPKHASMMQCMVHHPLSWPCMCLSRWARKANESTRKKGRLSKPLLADSKFYIQHYETAFSAALAGARTMASMGERFTEDNIFEAVLEEVPADIRAAYTAFSEESKAMKQLELAAGPTPM